MENYRQKYEQALPTKQLSEELEKAADYYLDNAPTADFMEGSYDGPQVLDAFRAGAHWQKEQMIKNYLYDYDTEYLTLANDKLPHVPVSCGLNVGDKVRILIIKEDEQ